MAAWVDAIRTVLGAGAGTSLVQFVIPFVKDFRERKHRAAYMALRLAVCLEAYAMECAHFISENTNAEQQPRDAKEEYPKWNESLPQPLEYPDDPDGWRALDRSLAGRCLNLSAKIKGSQRLIDSIAEHNKNDLDYALDEEAAQRGLEAWRLAEALRLANRVEPVEMVWDYAADLERWLSSAQERRAERARRQAGSTLYLQPPPES